MSWLLACRFGGVGPRWPVGIVEYVDLFRFVVTTDYTITYKMDKISLFYALVALISAVFAETCQKPEVTASAYVTEDATVLTNIAFTTQFVLKCNNGVKGISLYAEVEGKALPAVRLSADNKYQVIHLAIACFNIITIKILLLLLKIQFKYY